MGSLPSRSVNVQILNKTRNITLRNPKTYFDCGRCYLPLVSEVSPDASGTGRFMGRSSFWGVAGLLVYEADSFTLAIYFNNPTDRHIFPMELGLELSPGKAHLGRLKDTYDRMANGTYSSSRRDIQFNRGVVGRSHGTVRVSKGPIKVTATMSSDTDSLLKVVLEELGESRESGEEAGIENPCLERERLEKYLRSLKTRYQQ